MSGSENSRKSSCQFQSTYDRVRYFAKAHEVSSSRRKWSMETGPNPLTMMGLDRS